MLTVLSMHKKLIFSALIIASVAAAIASLITYRMVTKAAYQEAVITLEELASTVSETARTAAFVTDKQLASEVAEGLAGNSLVSCAELTASTMLIQAGKCYQAASAAKEFAGINNHSQRSLSSQRPNHSDLGPSYANELISPFSDEKIGDLTLFADSATIGRSIRETFTTIVLALLATIIAVAIAVGVAAHRLVTRPLEAFAESVQGINFSNESTARADRQKQIKAYTERKDEIGAIASALSEIIDEADGRITKETQLTTKTLQLSRYLKSLFDLSRHAICVCDEEFRLLSANFEFQMQFEIDEEDSSNRWVHRFFDDQQHEQLQEIRDAKQLNVPQSFEVEVQSPDDIIVSATWYEITYVKTQGGLEQHEFTNRTQIIFYIEDITERKLRHAITEFEASHDSLTGLLNRRAACDRITHMLNQGAPYESALLVIDLDDFKPVNDKHGHDAGDFVLKNIGERLRNITRNADVVARWGGDEFVIGLFNIRADEVLKTARKILEDMTKPFHYHDERLDHKVVLKIGACIGIAMPQNEEDSLEVLVDRADQAMYKIKQSGKNGVAIFGMD